jgi:hypothetical protein
MPPPVGRTSPLIHRPRVVLPQPLSPTSPKVSPGRTSKETPSTALTWPTTRWSAPSLIGKCFSTPRKVITERPAVFPESTGARASTAVMMSSD